MRGAPTPGKALLDALDAVARLEPWEHMVLDVEASGHPLFIRLADGSWYWQFRVTSGRSMSSDPMRPTLRVRSAEREAVVKAFVAAVSKDAHGGAES